MNGAPGVVLPFPPQQQQPQQQQKAASKSI